MGSGTTTTRLEGEFGITIDPTVVANGSYVLRMQASNASDLDYPLAAPVRQVDTWIEIDSGYPLRDQQDRLLNLRLMDEIDEHTFAAKNTELQDRIAELSLQLDVDDRSRAKQGELALKVFELSQTLNEKWLTADYRAKRWLLEMVCLNFFLCDVNLDVTLNKPFDVLAEGLDLAENRGDRI